MSLVHSRVLQKTDWLASPEPLRTIVTSLFTAARPQHDARRTEYVMALTAIDEVWRLGVPLTAVDVGGDGSPFAAMVHDLVSLRPAIVDPASGGPDLHHYLQTAPRLAHIVTCLSVLEHVPMRELPQFLSDLVTLLAPGGVLVLTADCAPTAVGEVKDTFHFHWMREQIFSVDTWHRQIVKPLLDRGLVPSGALDYPDAVQPFVYDYTFISLVLTKPERMR